MSVIEIAYFSVYIAIALGAGGGVLLGFAVLLHVDRRLGIWLQPFLIPVIALGISVSTLKSGRDLKLAATDLSLNTEGISSGGGWALRIFTLSMLGVCAARIVGQWLQDRDKPLLEKSELLFVSYVIFFVANNVLNSAFGTEPAFIHNLFYPIVLFTAAYVSRHQPLPFFITMAKVALLGMLLVSLVLAVIKPDLALQPGYRGWVPGLSVRLWGVGSHANSIGPLALVYMLIEYMQPWRSWLLRSLAVCAALAVFVLAQSKTVWSIAFLIAPVLAWYRFGKIKDGVDMRFALLVILGLSAFMLALLMVDPVRIWDKLVLSRAGGDITTLSGRSQIWNVAINEWLRNPLFGYGPEIWSLDFRIKVGMSFAFSAHNQFLQSLSAAGLAGAISLLAYMGALATYAWRFAERSKGVTLALFLLVAVRCISETPLTMGTLFNGDFLTHLLLFGLLAGYGSAIGRQTFAGNAKAATAISMGKVKK